MPQEFHCPLLPAMRHCAATAPLPAAQYSSVLREFHHALPPTIWQYTTRSSTAHCQLQCGTVQWGSPMSTAHCPYQTIHPTIPHPTKPHCMGIATYHLHHSRHNWKNYRTTHLRRWMQRIWVLAMTEANPPQALAWGCWEKIPMIPKETSKMSATTVYQTAAKNMYGSHKGGSRQP